MCKWVFIPPGQPSEKVSSRNNIYKGDEERGRAAGKVLEISHIPKVPLGYFKTALIKHPIIGMRK